MFFVMAIAGMVCTALSVSGQAITDLKTGYWLGSTPAAQERVKFLGVIAAAAAAGLTIVMLAKTFQFGEAVAGDSRVVLASPQASIMKALVESFMSRQPVAYVLFGGMIATTWVQIVKATLLMAGTLLLSVLVLRHFNYDLGAFFDAVGHVSYTDPQGNRVTLDFMTPGLRYKPPYGAIRSLRTRSPAWPKGGWPTS
jgi:hypothetical protein